MPRPTKCRRVWYSPDYLVFKPAGIPARQLQEVELMLDEFEAIRLADHEGLYHEEAAQKMHVSRQTFGNILASAHKKIAVMLIQGNALSIKGGNIDIRAERTFSCADCSARWSAPFGAGRPRHCPTCAGENVLRRK